MGRFEDNLSEKLAKYLSRFPNGVNQSDMWVFIGRWVQGKIHEWEAEGFIDSWDEGRRLAGTAKLRRYFDKTD